MNLSRREQIGKTVAEKRKQQGFTQQQMMQKTGINKTTLSEIENGRFTGSLDIFERYLDAVGLQLSSEPKRHALPHWDDIEQLFADDNE